jgi:hypothetical protein
MKKSTNSPGTQSNGTKTRTKVSQRLPSGWNEERVRRVIAHYENQTDEELAAEIEAVAPCHTLIEVPTELVPKIVQLIARHEGQKNRRRKVNRTN